MKPFPWLYISNTHIEGSHAGSWRLPRDGEADLPPVARLLDQLDRSVFRERRLGVVLDDDLLRPLRIALSEAPSAKELPQMLLWKLKRYLSYSPEQADLRFLPLSNEHQYLTFTLPKPWVTGLFAGLRERGVHCGYVGGLFASLLENGKWFKGSHNLCLFSRVYLLAELDSAGNYLSFRTRRLPFDGDGRLDVKTLIHADLEPALRTTGEGRSVKIVNFAPELDPFLATLTEGARSPSNPVICPALQGPAVQRFLQAGAL